MQIRARRSRLADLSVWRSHTNAGGEVIALDSGGFGPFTINNAVIVIGAPGVHAALTASPYKDGIDVAAGPSDSVEIRGLNITLLSDFGVGIYATRFAALAIENCRVNGGHAGILIAGVTGSHATVADTTIRASYLGYVIESRAALVRCRPETNVTNGLFVGPGLASDGGASVVDCVSVGNGSGAGVSSSTASRSTFLNLDRALISNNANHGIYAYSVPGASAAVRVTNSTVADNGGYGFYQFGASTFGSMNNNLVAGTWPATRTGRFLQSRCTDRRGNAETARGRKVIDDVTAPLLNVVDSGCRRRSAIRASLGPR